MTKEELLNKAIYTKLFSDVLVELNWMNQEQYNIINFK